MRAPALVRSRSRRAVAAMALLSLTCLLAGCFPPPFFDGRHGHYGRDDRYDLDDARSEHRHHDRDHDRGRQHHERGSDDHGDRGRQHHERGGHDHGD